MSAQASLPESFQWCVRLTRRTAGNFYYSFLALPRTQRRDMCSLYAFMRLTDDLGDDETQTVESRRQQLATWRVDIEKLIAGDGTLVTKHPAFAALGDIVQRYQIPQQHLLAVIDGVAMDLTAFRIETFADLEAYCYHVAGAVGLCCIHVWGFEGEAAEEYAVQCGLAFQLTNILRDIAEDIQRDRVYLPAEDLLKFGVNVTDLRGTTVSPALRELLAFEVARAEEYYQQARKLFALLKPAGRPIYAAMLGIYGGLLAEIRRRDYNVLAGRVSLSKCKKLSIAGRCVVLHKWLKRGL